jgi:hypothetical protein
MDVKAAQTTYLELHQAFMVAIKVVVKVPSHSIDVGLANFSCCLVMSFSYEMK